MEKHVVTKGELMRVINCVPDSAEIILIVDGVEYRAATADFDYSGFCDPQYTVVIRSALSAPAEQK